MAAGIPAARPPHLRYLPNDPSPLLLLQATKEEEALQQQQASHGAGEELLEGHTEHHPSGAAQ